MATRNFSDYDRAKVPNAENMCFGIVVSDRNHEITNSLLDGAVKTLDSYDALPENIHIKHVPTTFDLIYGARQMAKNDGYDAIIALGCVIKGATPNFEFICNGLSHGFAQLNITSDVPIIVGILTTNTPEQAQERSGGRLGNKGEETAVTAIKMAKF